MDATRTICTVSAGALLAVAAPAFAGTDREHDRYYRGAVVERYHAPVARERYARRPPTAVVERRVVVHQPVYVERQVVVERPVYIDRPVYVERPVPAPAYPSYYEAPYYETPAYGEPVYAPPAPAYSRGPNPVTTIGGAVIGAAIGSQVGDRDSRAATTALGAVIGGIIGSSF